MKILFLKNILFGKKIVFSKIIFNFFSSKLIAQHLIRIQIEPKSWIWIQIQWIWIHNTAADGPNCAGCWRSWRRSRPTCRRTGRTLPPSSTGSQPNHQSTRGGQPHLKQDIRGFSLRIGISVAEPVRYFSPQAPSQKNL